MPQVYASNGQVTGQGTLIAGNDEAFQAAQDIHNIGGTIDARNTMVASAGRDINSASTSESEVKMVLLEDAYSQIANGILWFVQEDEWSCAKASVSI